MSECTLYNYDHCFFCHLTMYTFMVGVVGLGLVGLGFLVSWGWLVGDVGW